MRRRPKVVNRVNKNRGGVFVEINVLAPDGPRYGRSPWSGAGMVLNHHLIKRDQVTLHAVSRETQDPSARAVLLLHGWPQTWWEWHHVLELLGQEYFVICPDLRGCGDSDKPQAGYDIKEIAADQFAVLDHLGVDQVAVVGHDIGGPAAYAMAALQPKRVTSLALLEAPLYGVSTEHNPEAAYWHMLFHQAPDIPEMLISGREEQYLRWFFRNFAYQKDAISEEALHRYALAYASVGGLRGGFSHYRAIPESAAQIRELSRVKLEQPVLAYGGEACLGGLVKLLALEVADKVSGGVVARCGHWISEEQPQFLVDTLTKFWRAS